MEALHVQPVAGATQPACAASEDLPPSPAGVKPRPLAEQLRDYWRVAEELERVKDRNHTIEEVFMQTVLRLGELNDENDRLRRLLARREKTANG